ncbi:MAG: hypothetical protein JJU30_12895 [Alkalimonas sp.]|nr:hypothetical protein [Alkalimonas sp.]
MKCVLLKQNGQAMVETAISLSFIIIPLLVLLPFLAKVTNLQHRADNSAQHIAWERTVWNEQSPSGLNNNNTPIRNNNEIISTIGPRFYGRQSRLIESSQQPWNWNSDINEFLRVQDSFGNYAPIITTINPQQNDSHVNQRLNTSINSSSMPSAGSVSIEPIARAFINLENNAYYRAGIETSVTNIRMSPLDALNLNISGNAALLTSGWNAAGPEHLVERIRQNPQTLPLTRADLGFLNTIRNASGFLPPYQELRANNLLLGHVDPDALPPSLLCTYGTINCGG